MANSNQPNYWIDKLVDLASKALVVGLGLGVFYCQEKSSQERAVQEERHKEKLVLYAEAIHYVANYLSQYPITIKEAFNGEMLFPNVRYAGTEAFTEVQANTLFGKLSLYTGSPEIPKSFANIISGTGSMNPKKELTNFINLLRKDLGYKERDVESDMIILVKMDSVAALERRAKNK